MPVLIVERRKAEKDLRKAPTDIISSYEIWVRLIEEHGLDILRHFKGYHDEKLSGPWQGFRSSRLSKKWHVIYKTDGKQALEVVTVERVTAHDYRRNK